MIPQSEWYDGSAAIGHNDVNWLVLLGARERGKSYWAMKWALNQFFKTKKRNFFYWIRLYDSEVKDLLKSNAAQLIDADLKRKYITRRGYDIIVNAPKVYICKRDKETGKIIKGSKRLLCIVLSLAEAGSSKGQAFYDKDWLKDNPDCIYRIIFDEFNRIPGQRKTFNVVDNLKIQIENLIRSTPDKVKIVCIANNVGTCSELLASWNFIPRGFGFFKLKKKGILIHNIPNNDAYVARRGKSALNKAFPMEEDSNYSNEQILDKSLIVSSKRKLVRPTYIIKFSKDPNHWYTVWDGFIIKQWNKEKAKIIPMRRYLDEVYSPEQIDAVVERFDNRVFKYKNLISFVRFQDDLEQIKTQK